MTLTARNTRRGVHVFEALGQILRQVTRTLLDDLSLRDGATGKEHTGHRCGSGYPQKVPPCQIHREFSVPLSLTCSRVTC